MAVDLRLITVSSILSYGSFLIFDELFNILQVSFLGEISWFLGGFTGIVISSAILDGVTVESVKIGIVSGLIAQLLGTFTNLSMAAQVVVGTGLVGQIISTSLSYLTIYTVSNTLGTSNVGSQIIEAIEN